MAKFNDARFLELEIFELINMERASRGLPTLLNDEALTGIALEWSRYLAETGNIAHGDFGGRVARIGYYNYQCGETIATCSGWLPTIGRRIVDLWLTFAEHRQIMMTTQKGYMGVGVSKGNQGFLCGSGFPIYITHPCEKLYYQGYGEGRYILVYDARKAFF